MESFSYNADTVPQRRVGAALPVELPGRYDLGVCRGLPNPAAPGARVFVSGGYHEVHLYDTTGRLLQRYPTGDVRVPGTAGLYYLIVLKDGKPTGRSSLIVR